MAVFTILYGNYYPPHGEFKLICRGKFSRRTWVNFTQQYGKNRQRCQQNKFTMRYGNYCCIFIDNFPQKFSPCIIVIHLFLVSVAYRDFNCWNKRLHGPRWGFRSIWTQLVGWTSRRWIIVGVSLLSSVCRCTNWCC